MNNSRMTKLSERIAKSDNENKSSNKESVETEKTHEVASDFSEKKNTEENSIEEKEKEKIVDEGKDKHVSVKIEEQ
jgi:hypothetical protein